MALDQAANFVVDELQSSVSDTATTFSVADAAQFPDPANGEYNLVVFDAIRPSEDPNVELVRVTGRDTTADELTVSRAQEGTTAASHPSASNVELSYTAKFRDDIQTEIDNAGGGVETLDPTSANGGPPDASGTDALALSVSQTAQSTAEDGIAIGNNADATGASSSISIGESSTADSGSLQVALGAGASVPEGSAVGIGRDVIVKSGARIGIGWGAEASNDSAVAIGPIVTSSGTNSVTLGTRDGNSNDSFARSPHDIALGPAAQTADTGTTSSDGHNIAIGRGARAGDNTNNVGVETIAIGRNASTNADNTISLGTDTAVDTANVARIGTSQTVIGAVDGGQIADADLNNSELTFELDEANSNIVFRVKNSSGTVKTGTVSLS